MFVHLYSPPATLEETPTPAGNYQMNMEDRQMILAATGSADINVKVRNKLYAAINRSMAKPNASLAMVNAWKEARDSGTHDGKFSFLKNFAQDTSGADLDIWESVAKSSKTYNDEKYMWVTKFDLFSGVRFFRWPGLHI